MFFLHYLVLFSIEIYIQFKQNLNGKCLQKKSKYQAIFSQSLSLAMYFPLLNILLCSGFLNSWNCLSGSLGDGTPNIFWVTPDTPYFNKRCTYKLCINENISPYWLFHFQNFNADYGLTPKQCAEVVAYTQLLKGQLYLALQYVWWVSLRPVLWIYK